MLFTLSKALDTCWNDTVFFYAGPWETPFQVEAGLRDEYEIYFLESGSGLFTVGGTSWHLRPGDTIFLSNAQANSFEPAPETPLFRFHLISFRFTRNRRAKQALDHKLALEHAWVVRAMDIASVTELTYRIEKIFRESRESNIFEVKLLLGCFIHSMMNEPLGPESVDNYLLGRSRTAARYVNLVVDYLQEHFAEKLTLEELGTAVGLNSSYLSRLYSDYTGTSIWNTLATIRLDRAKRMLKGTDLPVEDIAVNCGFGSSTYFSRCFNEKNGFSPREYRQQLRRSEQQKAAR